jgi:hypothetical protein
MLDKETLRYMAESERLMDAGILPFVWALRNGVYERLAVAPGIMEEFGLQKGQKVNSILVDAISERSMEILAERLDEIRQNVEDQFLTDDFDFRKEMNK